MIGAHRRYNPLLDEWVLCSPGRLRRPWHGASEQVVAPSPPRYDTDCYLCPGNERADGARNPDYPGVLLFDNDFPALAPTASGPESEPKRDPDPLQAPELFRSRLERGRCRVLCFSPRHDLHFQELAEAAVLQVVEAWVEETERMRRDDSAAYVQVFENRGAMMGASNPHPHGQIWGVTSVPSLPRRKAGLFADYARRHGRDLLGHYLAEELSREERVVWAGEHWVHLVPFWAVWPFETMFVPRRPVTRLAELDEGERRELAALLGAATSRYDRLFGVPFPYSFGWFERPSEARPEDGFRLHASYLPPLLRSANVRKFLVGYELTAEPQRDFLPEEAAERLRTIGAG